MYDDFIATASRGASQTPTLAPAMAFEPLHEPKSEPIPIVPPPSTTASAPALKPMRAFSHTSVCIYTNPYSEKARILTVSSDAILIKALAATLTITVAISLAHTLTHIPLFSRRLVFIAVVFLNSMARL